MNNSKTFYCIICLISVIILIWSLSRNNLVEKYEDNIKISVIIEEDNVEAVKELLKIKENDNEVSNSGSNLLNNMKKKIQ